MSDPARLDERFLVCDQNDTERERTLRTLADSPQARAEWAQCLIEDALLRRLAQPDLASFAPRRRRWRPAAVLAAAALLLIGITLGITLRDDGPPQAPAAKPVQAQGRDPDRFVGEHDGTNWHFLGGQLPAAEDGVWQFAETGALQLAVAPRNQSTPLRVRTPRATFTVLGTRFTVRHGNRWTQLAVHEGRVGVQPTDGNDKSEVAAGSWWRKDDSGTTSTGPLLDDDPVALYDFRQSPLAYFPNTGALGARADLLSKLQSPPEATATGLRLHGTGYLHSRAPLRFALTQGKQGIMSLTAWVRLHDIAAAPHTDLRVGSLFPRLPRKGEKPLIWSISAATLARLDTATSRLVHLALVRHRGRLVVLLNGGVYGYLPPEALPEAGVPQYFMIPPTPMPPGVEPPRWLRCALYDRMLDDAQIAAQIAAGPDGLVAWME